MTDEQARGVVGAVQAVSERLITALPVQFLMLLLINVLFILGLLWFLHAQSAPRERVLTQIVAACLSHPQNR
jgi:hypothetical protein